MISHDNRSQTTVSPSQTSGPAAPPFVIWCLKTFHSCTAIMYVAMCCSAITFSAAKLRRGLNNLHLIPELPQFNQQNFGIFFKIPKVSVFLVRFIEVPVLVFRCIANIEIKRENSLYQNDFIWYLDLLGQVNEVYGDKEDLEYEDLSRLVYLEQCIKECLRLHSPAEMSVRISPQVKTSVGKLIIPRGE